MRDLGRTRYDGQDAKPMEFAIGIDLQQLKAELLEMVALIDANRFFPKRIDRMIVDTDAGYQEREIYMAYTQGHLP